MKDGALLVNAARGVIVDTDALLAELTAGRIRAALDVTDPEPLPDGHPLWQAPGLLLTPHVGGAVHEARRPRLPAWSARSSPGSPPASRWPISSAIADISRGSGRIVAAGRLTTHDSK